MQLDESMKKPIGILMAILLLVLIIYIFALTRNAFTANTFIGRSDAQIYTITISGEGKVTAIPDIAQISLGLQTESKNVEDAQRENTNKMNSIISTLGELGIAKEDIKTSNYNIYPRYNYTRDRGQVLRGYEVSQSVIVKIRDLDKVGQVVERAGSLGANQVGGLNFTIDEPEELRQQARIKALENATEKAESLAKVAGVKLGKLVSFNENDFLQPPVFRTFALEAGIGGAVPTPDIEPGSQDITVNVTVTYEVL